MTLDKKIKIPNKLRSGMRAAAVGPTFRWYAILKSNCPLDILLKCLTLRMILYFITQFVHK